PAINGDRGSVIFAAAAEVGAVHQPRAIRAELGYEGVLNSMDATLKTGRGKTERGGVADDISGPGGIHGNAVGRVGRIAAQIGAVNQTVARRTQLRHKSVAISRQPGLQRGTHREILRGGGTRDVGAALRVDGDS